jgi:hypothetical protein
MLSTNIDQDQNGSGKKKWERDEIASVVVDYESEKAERSQRRFASENGVPRTTLQHWLNRKNSIDELPAVIDFFESPDGLAWLHRMVTAAHLEFGTNSPASIHNISRFFKLCGLDLFIAASYPSQRRTSIRMDEAIMEFGDREQKALAETMPEKKIALCEDETFHPQTCMVAIEPRSNFIVLEKYVENREAKTWNSVVEAALQGLRVEIIQVVSDEARGLINHTTKGMKAHHSSDCFHVSHEIVKGTSGPLNGSVKKAEKRVESATAETRNQICLKQEYDEKSKRPRGRRPHFEERIEAAVLVEKQALDDLEKAKHNREVVKEANREIGRCYHPYNPESGEKQDCGKVGDMLESCFESINAAIIELPDRCKKRVNKAHRVVKNMVANIAFFFLMINGYMDNMGLSPSERKLMHDYLIPGFYLQRAARTEKDSDRRGAISKKSEELLSMLTSPDGPLAGYSEDEIDALKKAAQDCAHFFQRSSSCVEGRNAQLSLRHHGIHRLSNRHLKALTIVHNYYIRNRDGTTPAERFFEASHKDLFEWLLENMDYPARPRQRFAKAA